METKLNNDENMKAFNALKTKYSSRWKTELAAMTVFAFVFPGLLLKAYPAPLGIKIAAIVAIIAVLICCCWYSIRYNRHMAKARDVDELLSLNREEGTRMIRFNRIAAAVACVGFIAVHYKGTFGSLFLVDCVFYGLLFAFLYWIDNLRFQKDTDKIIELRDSIEKM